MKKNIAEKAAETLKTLAHPARLRIAALLRNGELCVSEIVDAIGEKEPIVSQNLNRMKDKGILGSRHQGSKVFYYLKDAKMINGLLNCMVDGSVNDIWRKSSSTYKSV